MSEPLRTAPPNKFGHFRSTETLETESTMMQNGSKMQSVTAKTYSAFKPFRLRLTQNMRFPAQYLRFPTLYKVPSSGILTPVYSPKYPLDSEFSCFVKDSFDKLFALTALVFFAPLFIVLAIIIKLDSPGPIFYTPIRTGKNGNPFKMFKFRTMKENDLPSGGTLSTK